MASAVALIIVGALAVYLVTGGADFGGGIWELFASGPRADAQKKALRQAIAPIWEAHHVWLIVVVVLLFVCFPPAFAHIMIRLHIPLTLLLVGIVLRGSAFAFRSYSAGDQQLESRWERVFAISSAAAPMMLGVCAGATASGAIAVDASSPADIYVWPWLALFPLTIGGLTLSLCCYLAAVYMTAEVDDPALRDDFRRRGLAAAVAVGVFALAALLAARSGAPGLHQAHLGSWWSAPLHVLAAAAAIGAFAGLWKQAWRVARALAIGQTLLIIVGWALAQSPYLIAGAYTVEAAAAPPEVLRACLTVLAVGGTLVVPAFVSLYRLFKKTTA